MLRSGFSQFRLALNVLPYFAGVCGGAILLMLAHSEPIGAHVIACWTIPVLGMIQVSCAVMLVMGSLTPRQSYPSTVSLPVWVQKGIYSSGVLFAASILAIAAINLSVWTDCETQRLPNRSLAVCSIATQKVLFGDRAALRLVWNLNEIAMRRNDYPSAQHYKEVAEYVCMAIPSLHYKSVKLANGDKMHEFTNSGLGVPGSGFVHDDNSEVYFDENGLVEFGNGFFGPHPVDIGQKIRTVNVVEKVEGIKEYRFNGAANAQVVYTLGINTVDAYLPNGDTIHEFDINANQLPFKLKDGVNISFSDEISEPYPQMISVRLPPGIAAGVPIEDYACRARVTQRADGTTFVRLWNAFGNTCKTVIIPPNPKPEMTQYISSSEKQLRLFDDPKVNKWCNAVQYSAIH